MDDDNKTLDQLAKADCENSGNEDDLGDADFHDASEDDEEDEDRPKKSAPVVGPGFLAGLLQFTLSMAINLPESAKEVLQKTIDDAKKEIQHQDSAKQSSELPVVLDPSLGLSPLAALAPDANGGAGNRDSRHAPY